VSPERLIAADPSAKRKPRRKKTHIFGNVVAILGTQKFMVHFDNNTEQEMYSNTLKSHDHAESFPPNAAFSFSIAVSEGICGEDVPVSLDEL
jgi:hypothetical protein